MDEIKKMTEDEFYEKFHPVTNHIDNNASFSGCMFETYSPEIDFVFDLAKKEKRVWTIIEGDDDTMFYVTGFHYVNRLGFLITKETYEEEIEVQLDTNF